MEVAVSDSALFWWQTKAEGETALKAHGETIKQMFVVMTENNFFFDNVYKHRVPTSWL